MPEGAWQDNYLALVEIVLHLREGPRALWPDPDSDKEWLESFVKLSQSTISIHGPLEAISIYVVPTMIAPARSMPVVRFLSWNRPGDRERCKNGIVPWPDVNIDYYGLDGDDLPALDAAVGELQRSVAHFPTEVCGLNLDRLYPDPSQEPEVVFAPSNDSRPRSNRWVKLGMSASSIEFQFWEDTAPHLDAAWSALWTELKSKQQDQRRKANLKETYTLPPETMRGLLWGP
ncbi:MAG: hypothetical protein ACXWVI_05930 [Methyloceanibacter sp.]